jgi:hypothetical protein
VIYKQNQKIQNMLLQYFIHKEFVEPKMKAEKTSNAGAQCQMDREVQIKIPEKKIVDNTDQITPQFRSNSQTKTEAKTEASNPYLMTITKCSHTNRKHYAKNMCSTCYRKQGRDKYATKCEHQDRLLYSKGMC